MNTSEFYVLQFVASMTAKDIWPSHALGDLVNEEQALTRVIVTRAEKDLKEIKDVFAKRNNATIHEIVDRKTWGNYKAFLLALLGKE
ncbi:annexin-like protein rj4-like [Trifolium pratense]|uniref:Annexin-like protein rj4-like n=1 Tax=Trifolium pratense TaxID=57577 RepID=A0A2K3KT50_TRIPR|nr:annexin-like protein rj4-like [Trifolium pratense]